VVHHARATRFDHRLRSIPNGREHFPVTGHCGVSNMTPICRWLFIGAKAIRCRKNRCRRSRQDRFSETERWERFLPRKWEPAERWMGFTANPIIQHLLPAEPGTTSPAYYLRQRRMFDRTRHLRPTTRRSCRCPLPADHGATIVLRLVNGGLTPCTSPPSSTSRWT